MNLTKSNFYKFVSRLSGHLSSLEGNIKNINSMYDETPHSIAIEVEIMEDKITGDFIFKLWNEINSRIDDVYYESEGSTTIRIRTLILTGGIGIDNIGISLNQAATTSLPMEKVKWIKEPFSIMEMRDMLINSPQEIRAQMLLGEDDVNKINHSLSQIKAQKNVPHNLQVQLEFIEEGEIELDLKMKTNQDYPIMFAKGHYKLPEDTELNFKLDKSNHNKITGKLNLKSQHITVEVDKGYLPLDVSEHIAMHEVAAKEINDIFISNNIHLTDFLKSFRDIVIPNHGGKQFQTTDMIVPVKIKFV